MAQIFYGVTLFETVTCLILLIACSANINPSKWTLTLGPCIYYTVYQTSGLFWNYFSDCCIVFILTLNAPIATKAVCFSRLLNCIRSLYGKQCGPRSDCSCSGSTMFASILNLSAMLGNYLQQTTSADNIFRCIFFLAL